MSLRTLPQPPGPYHVGTGSRELVDLYRTSQIVSDGLGRKIFVKFWYPTNKSFTDDSKREALWEQLRTETNIPGIVRLLLRRAMKTMTNSYLDAPISAEVSPFRILIYNHGMISFAAENTILMEYLASRGYIVLALQHKEQLQEFQTLQKRLPEQLKKRTVTASEGYPKCSRQ